MCVYSLFMHSLFFVPFFDCFRGWRHNPSDFISVKLVVPSNTQNKLSQTFPICIYCISAAKNFALCILRFAFCIYCILKCCFLRKYPNWRLNLSFKDAYEDFRRRRLDKQINCSYCHVWDRLVDYWNDEIFFSMLEKKIM